MHIHSCNATLSRVKPLSIKTRSSKPQRFKKHARVFGDHDKDLISLGIDVDQLSVREHEETMDEINEDDYDKAIEYGHELYDMHQSDLKQEKKIILRKILQRKHFRGPPEPCLLTYAAKQQIRYLHQLDPDEWTPKLLAESFPISVGGVKKLLKNNSVLKGEEKIRDHDQLVAQRWKQLMGGQSIGLSSSLNQRFLEGKLSPVCAVGNASLPLPIEKPIQIAAGVRKPTGQFLAIVKPYLELKETAALREKECQEKSAASVGEKGNLGYRESTKTCELSQKSNMKYSENRKTKNGIELDLSKTIETFQKKHKSSKTVGETSDLDSELVSRQKLEHSKKWNRKNINVKEELEKEIGWNVSESTKKSRDPINFTAEQFQANLRRDLEVNHSNSEMDKIILKWLENKDKEEDLVADVSPATYSSTIKTPGNIKQYENNTIEIMVDVNEDETRRDSYLYDSKHGYQHPVGKWDVDLENITIPKQLYTEGAVYRKGRSYYDDKGEFMYRVPLEAEKQLD